MPTYRPSRFNIHVPRADGALHAIYNTATGNYLVVDEPQRQAYEALRAGEADGGRDGTLAEAGFAVADGVDEVEAVSQVFGRFRSSRYAPHLTIAPTLDCNFGCAYCFETHKPGNMTPAMQEHLLAFTRVLLERSRGGRRLSISWFGGEPLMAFPVIERLSERFLAWREAGELESYSAMLITNGIGLTRKVCDRLARLAISSIQITIDGPREVHDARRFLKRGRGPTFDRILQNVGNVDPSIPITVRVNVDRDNSDELTALGEQFAERGLLNRVAFDIARVERFSIASDPAPIISPRAFAEFKGRMRALFAERGWPLHDHAPAPSLQGVCQVDSQNSFVVGADGKLYKCWAELENDGFCVGRLDRPTGWDGIVPSPMAQRDPFDDPECRSCALLPTCLGSCPKVRSMNRQLGRKECPPFKYRMADLLRAQFGGRTHIARRLPSA